MSVQSILKLERGSVRPLLAISSFLACLALQLIQGSVPELFAAFAVSINAFYFGARAHETAQGVDRENPRS